MSLKVWLPLTGTLENKGISNITVTNNGATVNTSGKIGSCYLFDGIDNYLELSNINPNGWPEISVAFWFYSDGTMNSFFLIRAGNQHRFRINGTGAAFRDTQNTSTQRTVNWSNTLPINTWTHVVYIYNRGAITLYKNGILDTYNTNYYNENSTINASSLNSIRIGRIQSTSDNTYYNGKINDFRIYDHALSAAEVKEISQGLVLHYKLDDTYAETTTNLYSGTFSNTCYNGATSKYGYGTNTDIYKTTGNFQGKESVKVYMGTAGLNAYPYVYFNAFNTTGSNIHTLSFDYYPTTQTSIIPYSYNGAYNISYLTSNGAYDSKTNVSSVTIPVITNQWNHISITMQKYDTTNTTRGNGYIRIGSAKHTSTTTDYWLFANIQVEAKDHETGYTAPNTTRSDVTIQDSSGYGHNAVSNGSAAIAIDSTTPRYNFAVKFITGTRIATTVGTASFMPTDMLTVNIWFKSSDAAKRFLSCAETGGFNFESSSGYIRFPLYINGNGYTYCTSSTTTWSSLSDNKWHMITATYDRIQSKLYIDGILDTSTNSSYPNINIKYNANTPLTLGAEAQTIASPIAGTYVGNLSDLRIYCTALSADDILELYHTSAKIDNLSNIHTFEFAEGNTSTKITKQGQFKTKVIQEAVNQSLAYDKTLYTEPDGSTWIHIFHHNNPANARFSGSANDWSSGLYLDADRWYNIEVFLNDTLPYEFMVKQKTTSSATETKYRWIQTPNPLTATWTDVKPGTVTFITTSGYSSSSYGGMYLMKSSNLHMCIANASSGNWYGGIGASGLYNGGIPGYPNTTVTSGYIDLYLRIYSTAKIIKDIGIGSNTLIEK